MSLAKALDILEPNECRTLHTVISKSLIRTGTIGDGSCFFHALYHSISKEYRSASIAERHTFVASMRKKMASEFSEITWKQIGNGELFRSLFLSKLHTVLRGIYEMIASKNDTGKEAEHRFPFSGYISFEVWDKEILPKLSTVWHNVSLEECASHICSHLTNVSGNININKDIHKFLLLLCQLAFSEFKGYLENAWVDDIILSCIAHMYDYNFVFINANGRAPYKTYGERNQPRTVFFLWVKESHYESVGYRTSERRIRRVFKRNDELVKAYESYVESAT